VFNSINFSITR